MHADIGFICNSVNGRLILNNSTSIINGVETDSRYVKAGTLFFALKGEKHDGHDFVVQAFKNGAEAAVISKNIAYEAATFEGKSLIKVEDTLQALQDFARAYRSLYNIPVIAVTGSVGKTTTRDIIACCLQSSFITLKTEANYNNDIGLPLTILKLNDKHQAAVVEMAMRGLGEIERLAKIARPTCAVISNIEPVHLETLGTLGNIAQAKCEVLAELNKDSFAVINGDNNLLLRTANKYPCRKYTFGYNEGCDFQVVDVCLKEKGIIMTARLLESKQEFYFPVPSVRLAGNVISAVAVATLLGVNIDKIRSGLSDYKASGNRLNIMQVTEGGIIINDTYNANPVSMAAALETGKGLAGSNNFIAVLGDMYELGAYEVPGHIEVGKKAAATGVDVLIAVGERARHIARGALEAGMPENRVLYFASKAAALEYLCNSAKRSDTVLFKASRGMKLETMVDAWKNKSQ